MEVRGKKVTVVGLGRTALALTRLLVREGAEPFVTEQNSGPRLEALQAELQAMGVPYEVGGHTAEAFRDTALVIPSPGVSPAIPPIVQSVESGADLVSEMEFAFAHCRSRLLAVSGTNGKTTTTELLRTLVDGCGHTVLLAGNNAFPFSAAVAVDPAPEYIVLEVSSYQLENTRAFRPWLAAVLNVTPDHLARHGSVEEYGRVKARIFARQDGGDSAIINADDPIVSQMRPGQAAALWPFSLTHALANGLWVDGPAIMHGTSPVATVSDVRLPGRHNLENALCALSMMRAGGFDWDKTLAALRCFKGVEHRIEFVMEKDGVAFYNDSKSTNIDSLKVALESFDSPVVLIAGGEGKGTDYGVLRDLVARRVKVLVTLGDDAPKLEAAFGDLVDTRCASDMADAVRRAAAAAAGGGIVLLSPACASFDMFDNFEHRGRVFKECVMGLAR